MISRLMDMESIMPWRHLDFKRFIWYGMILRDSYGMA